MLSHRTLGLLAWLTAAVASPARAVDLDEKVVDLVKKTSAFYSAAKSIHVEGKIVTDLREGPFKHVSYSTTYDLVAPNKFKFTLRNDDDKKGGLDLFANGDTLAAYALRYNEYLKHDAPADYVGLGEQLMRLGHHHTGMLFQNLLNDDPAKIMLDGVESCEYAGLEKVDDVETHHLKFAQEGMNWELWIATGEKPLVLKATSDRQNGGMVTVETYANWKLDEEIEDKQFAFAPPEGAKQVERLQLRKPEDAKK